MRRWLDLAGNLLRIAGVAALCAGILGAVYLMEKLPVAYTAEVIFAGTKAEADCTLFISRGHCVVLDTGEEQDAAHILKLLKEKNIEKIDCMILTHQDKDHMGGTMQILDEFPVAQVIAPYYEKNKTAYDDLLYQMRRQDIPCLTLMRKREFSFGELKFRIFPPMETHYQNSNDNSLAVLVQHGKVRMFFAGDAMQERMEEYLDYQIGSVNLYKVSWHGRDIAAQTPLIRELNPEFAVVTAQKEEDATKMALEEVSAKVFYTVGRNLYFQSDGKRLVAGH